MTNSKQELIGFVIQELLRKVSTQEITREEAKEAIEHIIKVSVEEERQRVVEMIKQISKEYPVGKLYFEWLVLDLESKLEDKLD